MKLASTALKNFLAAPPANIRMVDLYTFATGSGRIVLNEKHTPASLHVTIAPPLSGTFVQDLGVREANGDITTYTVNNSTGVYTFSDNNPKLISYVFRIGGGYGLAAPTIVQVCSGDKNVTMWGQTFLAAGVINNPSGNPAPAIQRSKLRTSIGLEVATMDIDVFADPASQIGTTPLLQAIAQGTFDGAAVYVQRLYSQSYGDTSLGPLILFSGSVAEIEIARAHAKLTVKARTELLDLQMPRNLIQPGCRHTLFDTGCTLNASSFAVSGAVASGSNRATLNTGLSQHGSIPPPSSAPSLGDTSGTGVNLNATVYWVVTTYVTAQGETTISAYASRSVAANRLLTVASPGAATGATGWNVYVGTAPNSWQLQNASPIAIGTGWTEPVAGLVQGAAPPIVTTTGYFELGVISFTTGPNAGVSRVVASYDTGGTLTVIPPLPNTPTTGDLFTILPGCDKTQNTCANKFSNLIHFGGFPYVPQPEAAI